MHTTATAVLQPDEAATFLGISLPELWAAAGRKGDFPKPCELFPGATVWSRAQLEAYRSAEQARATTKDAAAD